MGRLAPQELPYVNVGPSHTAPSSLGARSYAEYLNRYLRTVRPPLLSFDHYPLLERGITPDYFLNWAQARSFSLGLGVPLWGFVQSVGFSQGRGGLPRRRAPNQAELFWQINVALAYGAKGLQYFTYWTPEDDPRTRFGSALVSREGRRTPLYGYAQNANRYLGVIGKALLRLASESVVHARTRRLPRGARAFRADGYVRSVVGSAVILGRFKDPATEAERHLFVANHSSANKANSRLTLSNTVREVSEVDRTTGERVPVRFAGHQGTARLDRAGKGQAVRAANRLGNFVATNVEAARGSIRPQRIGGQDLDCGLNGSEAPEVGWFSSRLERDVFAAFPALTVLPCPVPRRTSGCDDCLGPPRKRSPSSRQRRR